MVLPLISRAILQTFRCVTYDETDEYSTERGAEFMFVDPAIDCRGAKYRFMVIYASANVLIWPVGVPLGLLVCLWRISRFLDPPGVPEAQAIIKRRTNEHVSESAVAFLALQYKPRYWYYEVIFSLSRRLVLTSVVLVFESRGQFIVFVLSVSIIVSVCERELNAFIEPYTGAFVYLMTWQILLCVTAMLIMDSRITDDVDEVLLGALLVFMNASLFVIVIIDTRGDIMRERIEKAHRRGTAFLQKAKDSGRNRHSIINRRSIATRRDRGDIKASERSDIERHSIIDRTQSVQPRQEAWASKASSGYSGEMGVAESKLSDERGRFSGGDDEAAAEPSRVVARLFSTKDSSDHNEKKAGAAALTGAEVAEVLGQAERLPA